MSLCENLIQIIEEQAGTEKFGRVKAIYLEIGAFACVEIEALRFCFDIVCRGTIAESAELIITKLPGRAWCFDCEKEIGLPDRLEPCPKCKGFRLRYIGGEEMRIKELEVC